MLLQSIVSVKISKHLELLTLSHTEAVCVLHPILSKGSSSGSGVTYDVVEPHVCSIHDVETPKRRIFDLEVLDGNVADIPPYKRHRSAWLCDTCFNSIPDISVAIDAARTVPVDRDVVSREHNTSSVILERDRV